MLRILVVASMQQAVNVLAREGQALLAHTACSGPDGRVARQRFEDAPSDDSALSVCKSSDRRVAIEL